MYLVVFRNRKRADIDQSAYDAESAAMERLAEEQPGYRSFKSYVAEDGEVIALSEWDDEASARGWGKVAEHLVAKANGRERYYDSYTLYACPDPRTHHFERAVGVRSMLRPGWYSHSNDDEFDLDQSGIYEWRIAGVGLYVGKAKTLRKRIRDYPNNVRRMISGLPWHGNPRRNYRQIHHELRRAHDEGNQVSVAVLETCDPSVRAEREAHWIAQRQAEALVGGPPVLNSF